MKDELSIALNISGVIGKVPIDENVYNTRFNIDLVDEVINEGVFSSYGADSIYNVLDRKYKIAGIHEIENPKIDFCVGFDGYRKKDGDVPEGEVIVIVFFIPDKFTDKDKVLRFMGRSGWSLADEQKMKGREDVTVYKYEKDRQTEEQKTPDYLFHLTPSNKTEKIMRQGLTPHSGNKLSDHIERIYLLPQFSFSMSYSMIASSLRKAQHDKNSFNGNKINSEDIPYSLLKIDTRKCRPNFKIYGDPNMNGAYWTFDNIPPEAIKVIKNDL